MILLEPSPTPFDLNWRMFGTPIRVHPFFWLMTIFLGWSYRPLGWAYLLLWVLCVFVSILLHEFGHVWMGRFFGRSGYIVLHSFGGLAISSDQLWNRWQRIAVSLAGPLIQLIPLGIVWYIKRHFEELFGLDFVISDTGTKVWTALWMLYVINLYWPILNLLPIWPLDGGQVSRELFDWFIPGRGRRASLGLSMAVSSLIALNALVAVANKSREGFIPHLPAGQEYTIFLFGLLALSNFLEFQQTSAPSRGWERESRRAPWEQDPDYWKK